MFLYLVTCLQRVTVSLLCRYQAISKIHIPIYPYLINEGRRNFRACDRHRNETVTLRKHVAKYKYMPNEWLNSSENLRVVMIKLSELLNSHHQIYRITLILYGVGVSCDVDIFKLTARAQPIYRDVYGLSRNRFMYQRWLFSGSHNTCN